MRCRERSERCPRNVRVYGIYEVRPSVTVRSVLLSLIILSVPSHLFKKPSLGEKIELLPKINVRYF